ncbi:GIY-YIG nuclease family protein [Halosimplex pelagicum]|uniref:GIY-YIG nuclease family protein n=1 Tax=Halosimplex pelagicum TaxID=869886 RepID=A0A7D5T7F7_9EURY|nr:GIY-YIG nuclease family protein [Halosimplex pelagicum]QLH80230.1 GIY-YIG nuclease family protein [Halosimplex pelagicum]
MAEGTYTLLVELAAPATIEVGALGEVEFAAGAYAYTGSAFGPGGFARVERHRELAAGERDARHWHVDYLLGNPDAAVAAVVRTADADVECAVSRTLAGADGIERVAGFGASDCDCDSHLVRAAEGERLRRAVERAHGAADGAGATNG